MNATRFRYRRSPNVIQYKMVSYGFTRSPTCSDPLQWNVTADPSYSTYTVGLYETMDDEVVPGYARRVANGEVFFNSMTKSSVFTDTGSGQPAITQSTSTSCSGSSQYKPQQKWDCVGLGFGKYTSQLGGIPSAGSRIFLPTSLFSGEEIAALISEASTSCLNNRGRSNMNAFETFAEANQIVSGMVGPLTAAYAFVRNRKKFRSILEHSSSGYLAWKYGMSPIISEVSNAIEQLRKTRSGVNRHTARGYASDSRTKTETGYTSWATFMCSHVNTQTESIDVRAMSLDEYEADLGFDLGFNSKNLVTLPWELVNKSFVVDWFTNIGDLIGSLVPTPGIKALGSCYVLRREHKVLHHISGTTPNNGYTIITPASGQDSKVWTSKMRVPGALSPSLLIRTNFGLDSVSRVSTLLALIVQQVKRF